MCGYLIDESKMHELKSIGAKDSKLLTAEKRENLSPLLKEMADDFVVLKITAKEIDELRNETNLNVIEIGRMQHIINIMKPDKVIIDSAEAKTAGFPRKRRCSRRQKVSRLKPGSVQSQGGPQCGETYALSFL